VLNTLQCGEEWYWVC